MTLIDRRHVALAALSLATACATPTSAQIASIDSAGAARVARARRALRQRTIYDLDEPPPAGDQWPQGWRTDCSGFIAWVHGLPRRPARYNTLNPNAQELFTDTLYDDATWRHIYFREVRSPEPGDVIVYPTWRDSAGVTEIGHMALVSEVISAERFTIIDCAKSVYCDTGDAISERAPRAFERHRVRLREVRAAAPALTDLKDPIFARFTG